jgi:RNA-directed DNA polymerase
MGGWAVAQSPMLGTTITLERLIKRGYQSMFSYYQQVSPHLCAGALWCAGTTQ